METYGLFLFWINKLTKKPSKLKKIILWGLKSQPTDHQSVIIATKPILSNTNWPAVNIWGIKMLIMPIYFIEICCQYAGITKLVSSFVFIYTSTVTASDIWDFFLCTLIVKIYFHCSAAIVPTVVLRDGNLDLVWNQWNSDLRKFGFLLSKGRTQCLHISDSGPV